MFVARLDTIELALAANREGRNRYEYISETNYTFPEHRMVCNDAERKLLDVKRLVKKGDKPGLAALIADTKAKYRKGCNLDPRKVKSQSF